MDPITQQTTLASAGGKKDSIYVDDVFSTFLYKGDGTNNDSKAITTGLDIATEGGLVWIKSREASGAGDDNIFVSPGITGYLRSNFNNAKTGNSGDLAVPTATGFTVNTKNSGGTWYYTNGANKKYTSWSLRKAPGFFDVVTWNGNNTAGRVIPHSLGSAPGMVLIKSTSSGYDWVVWHRSLANSEYLYLNSTAAKASSDNYFNNTTPDASGITLSSSGHVNGNGESYVAYIFAHDAAQFGTNNNESIIKCGSFTTNGSGAATVDLGWEPQWVITKKSSATGNWGINDSMRGMPGGKSTAAQPYAQGTFADLNNAEGNWDAVSPTSTGFNVLANGLLGTNTTGIYIAIRRPHKPPSTATEVFATKFSTQAEGAEFTTNFPVDLTFSCLPNNGVIGAVQDRLRGYPTVSSGAGSYPVMFSWSTASEATFYNSSPYACFSDSNTSIKIGSNLASANSLIHAFKRAPGFMDVVPYRANNTANRSINHNLGVTPELIIWKNRSYSAYWRGWFKDLPNKYWTVFNGGASIAGSYISANSTTFSYSTVFADGSNNSHSWDYVAYLFATLPGISKVGSYTGTGNNIDVDCGFTGGARFVMIKRDGNGSWYCWDTSRGIVSGNDPYVAFDLLANQVTNTDYIDPLNTGFTVTSSAPAELNHSGDTYIYLAIA